MGERTGSHGSGALIADTSGCWHSPASGFCPSCQARLILHIPDVRERQVTYYGPYANASRHRRQKRRSAEPDVGFVPLAELEEPTPFELRRRMRWAQLIKKVWLQDPLLCPECGGEMRIIIAPGKAWERGKSCEAMSGNLSKGPSRSGSSPSPSSSQPCTFGPALWSQPFSGSC